MTSATNVLAIFALGLFAFFVLIAMALRPFWGLVLTVTSFPLNTAAELGKFSVIKSLGLLTLLFWFVQAALGKLRYRSAKQFLWVVVLIAIGAALSSVARDFHTHKTMLLIVTRDSVFYFLTIQLVRKEDEAALLLRIGLVSFAIIGALAIYQAFVDPYFLAKERTFTEFGVRASATFKDQGQFGREFVGWFPIGMGLAVLARSKVERILAAAGAALVAGGVLVSQTRGSWIAMVFALAAVAFETKGKRSAVPLMVGMLSIVAVWYMGGLVFERRLQALYLQPDLAVRYRLGAIISGLHMLRDHWLVGVGIGNFYLYVFQYAVLPVRVGMDAHNWVIEVLTEWGIPGFFAFGMVIFLSLQDAWKTRDTYPLNRYLFYAILTVAIAGLTETLITVKAFWLFAGLATALAKSKEASYRP